MRHRYVSLQKNWQVHGLPMAAYHPQNGIWMQRRFWWNFRELMPACWCAFWRNIAFPPTDSVRLEQGTRRFGEIPFRSRMIE